MNAVTFICTWWWDSKQLSTTSTGRTTTSALHVNYMESVSYLDLRLVRFVKWLSLLYYVGHFANLRHLIGGSIPPLVTSICGLENNKCKGSWEIKFISLLIGFCVQYVYMVASLTFPTLKNAIGQSFTCLKMTLYIFKVHIELRFTNWRRCQRPLLFH